MHDAEEFYLKLMDTIDEALRKESFKTIVSDLFSYTSQEKNTCDSCHQVSIPEKHFDKLLTLKIKPLTYDAFNNPSEVKPFYKFFFDFPN